MELSSGKVAGGFASPMFPILSAEMAKTATKPVANQDMIIERLIEKLQAEHGARLLDTLVEACQVADKVNASITADIKRNDEFENSIGSSERLNDLLDTPIGLTFRAPQPQLLRFCVCGSGEKPPKRRRTVTGISQSSGSDEYKCSDCSSELSRSDEAGRRKTFPLMAEGIKIVVTQK